MTDVAVVGPGAVGTTFGAAAERAGHAVVLCGRRAAPAPVVESPGGEEHALAGAVLGDPATGRPVPWVLLAVKIHQTAGAAPWLERLCGPNTVLAVLHNGVEHEALAGPHAGPATVLPAIVWTASEAVPPGRVQQRDPPRLVVPDTAAGTALAALLGDQAQVELEADFLTAAWRKLCLNASSAPMVLEGRRAELFREPAQLELARGLAAEAVAVGRAEGARLAPDTVAEIAGWLARQPPGKGTSMLFDRLAGRPLEWEARNGVVSRLGARHDIPTPLSDRVAAQLAALDRAG